MAVPIPKNGILDSLFATILSSEVGTAASLISLVLTLWVLRSIYILRSNFLIAARLPQLLEDLQQNTSGLSQGLAQPDEWSDLVDIELARCSANLKNLVPKVRGQTRTSVAQIQEEIDTYLSSDRSKSKARAIYTKLNGLLQELHNLREDRKWSE